MHAKSLCTATSNQIITRPNAFWGGASRPPRAPPPRWRWRRRLPGPPWAISRPRAGLSGRSDSRGWSNSSRWGFWSSKRILVVLELLLVNASLPIVSHGIASEYTLSLRLDLCVHSVPQTRSGFCRMSVNVRRAVNEKHVRSPSPPSL